MTFAFQPICMGCTHVRDGLTCAAFPARIPDAILDSAADHRQPYDGDQGIQFAPKDAAAAHYADRLFAPLPQHDTTHRARSIVFRSQPSHTGCMVALMLPGAIAQQIAIPNGEAVQDLHITLAYLGDIVENAIDKDALLATVQTWAAKQHPLHVDLGDLDTFPGNPDDGKPVILHAYADALHAMRADLMTQLNAAHVTDFAQTFPIYSPHVTLAYIPQDAPLPTNTVPAQHPVFTTAWVCYGDERHAFSLGPSVEDEQRAIVADMRATLAEVRRQLQQEY